MIPFGKVSSTAANLSPSKRLMNPLPAPPLNTQSSPARSAEIAPIRVPPSPSASLYVTTPLRTIFTTPCLSVPIQRLPSPSSARDMTSLIPLADVYFINRCPSCSAEGKNSLKASQVPTHNLPSEDRSKQLTLLPDSPSFVV